MLTLTYAFVLLATLQVLKADLLPKDGECGLNFNDNFLGGAETSITDYPWTVRLQYKNGNSSRFFCGGTLISKRYVITQARCLSLLGSWKLTGVRVGQSNATFDGSVIVPIEEQIVHENYSKKNKIPDNNIALIRLNIDIDFMELKRPICLPKSQEDQINKYNGQELVVTGFGRSYDDDTINIKKQYILTGIENNECTKKYQNFYKVVIGDGKLCASATNTFCAGSAGNPLMVQKNNAWLLVGIQSTGTPCNVDFKNRLPTIYTMVGYHIDWILKNMKA